jgi:hypothetical protein
VCVPNTTEAKTPDNQRQVWSGEESQLSLKWKMIKKERMSTKELRDRTLMGMEKRWIRKDI